jgi:hypothetical protein
MRFWRRGGSEMATTMTAAEMPDDEVFECRGVLVAHADGTLECDEAHECGADEAVHEWWVPCTELGCGCTGDEGDVVELRPTREVVLLAA